MSELGEVEAGVVAYLDGVGWHQEAFHLECNLLGQRRDNQGAMGLGGDA